MKPSGITKILEVTYELRKMSRKFIPLFSGDAGLGKSEICQAWVKEKRKTNPSFGFFDLRLAYLEAPDFVGLTKLVEIDNQTRTKNILPSMWPTQGEGLLLFEEPNRSNSSNLNALMQVLTDREIHGYKLPEGWIMASCINPDNGNYDVTNMDTALKNRFEIFDIKYDFKEHVAFMKANEYDPNIISFVEGGHWVFKEADAIDSANGTYISPRTFSKLNDARASTILRADDELHYDACVANLGKAYGLAFHKYVNEQKPLIAKDFIGKKLEKSLEKLTQYSDPNNRRDDLLNITTTSVADEFGLSIDDDTLVKIVSRLPADLGTGLLTDAFVKIKVKAREGKLKQEVKPFKEWIKAYPELQESVTLRLKGSYTSGAPEEPTKKKAAKK